MYHIQLSSILTKRNLKLIKREEYKELNDLWISKEH